jgi:hypothetical protein
MARLHGSDLSTLTLGGQTLLADTISIGPKLSVATHDTTTIGDDWMESTAGLLGGDEFDHEMFYDNTNTTGTYAYLMAKLIAKAPVPLVISDATRTLTGDVLVTGVSDPISVGDMRKITASYKWTGTVTPS